MYTDIPVEIDIDGSTRSISQQYYQSSSGYYYSYTTEYGQRAYNSFNLNLLFGCDFYLIKNLYLGLEAGFGYNHTSYQKINIDISNQVNPTVIPSYRTNYTGFFYNSALRLGLWF